MGLTYQDVAMVNNSLDNLGNTLARNRLMAEQQQQRAEERQLRAQDRAEVTKFRTDQLAENAKHHRAVEGELQLGNTLKQLETTTKDLGDSIEGYRSYVVGGDAAGYQQRAQDAQDSIARTVAGIGDEKIKSAMTTHFAPFIQGKVDWKTLPSRTRSAAEKEPPSLTKANLPGYSGALTPGGAYILPDADKTQAEMDKKMFANLLGRQAKLQKKWDDLVADDTLRQDVKIAKLRAAKAEMADMSAELDEFKRGQMRPMDAGSEATPPDNEETTGEETPTPTKLNAADVELALKDANDAINGVGIYKGKPRNREMVLRRLKEMGIQVKE